MEGGRKSSTYYMKILPFSVFFHLQKKKRIIKKAKLNPNYWNFVQNERIRKFVKEIYNIPFYHDRFLYAGIEPEDIKSAEDFLKLPTLSKNEFKTYLNSVPKQELDYMLEGGTSGSTGIPLKIYHHPMEMAEIYANLYCCPIVQEKGFHVFFDKGLSTFSAPDGVRSRFPYFENVRCIDGAKKMLDALLRVRPGFYYGTKISLFETSRYAEENNISDFGFLKCVGSTAEKLSASDRNYINKVLGVNVFDIYGCEEMGNMAVEISPGKHLIWNDSFVINVINRTDISPGRYRGDICVTSLIHTSFPRVNYLIGDEVEIIEENGIKYLTDIIGRSNDKIKNMDGSSYSWSTVYRILDELTEIEQYRVVQKDYDNLVFILAAHIPEDRKRLLEDIMNSRAEVLFYNDKKKIQYEWRDKIPMDSTGKLRVLISEI